MICSSERIKEIAMKCELNNARKSGTRPGPRLKSLTGSVSKLAIPTGDFSSYNQPRNAILNAFEAAIL